MHRHFRSALAYGKDALGAIQHELSAMIAAENSDATARLRDVKSAVLAE